MRVEQCVVLCMQQSLRPHIRLCVIMDACNTFGRRARAYVDKNARQGNKGEVFFLTTGVFQFCAGADAQDILLLEIDSPIITLAIDFLTRFFLYFSFVFI